MKKITILLILLFLRCFDGNSQTENQIDALRKAQLREFTEFSSKIDSEYKSYLDSLNKAFSDYLRKTWKGFNLQVEVRHDTTPKPGVLPRFDPKIEKLPSGQTSLQIIIKLPSEENVPSVNPLPNNYPTEVPVSEVLNGKNAFIDFYGSQLKFQYDPELNGTLPPIIVNTTIADFWDRMNKANSAVLIQKLSDFRSQMNLNDWGFFMLVKKTVESINPDANYSRLLTWYLLTKSGYRVRVAYMENRIVLMFPSVTKIYNFRYFTASDVKFYSPECELNNIFTYEFDYPGATRIFDMNIYRAPDLGTENGERTLLFTYNDKEYRFPLIYNQNSIDFYKDYPLCDLKVYFDAGVSATLRESIVNTLKPQIESMTLREAAGFLLKLVQTGFDYKTDQEQFGKEKFNFPEETLYFPYADCDDRAVFFSYLVKEILGLKMIGVVYPGHVATAICFPTEEEGNFIIYKGIKYIIADPTYIDAPVGLSMPGKSNSQAEAIEVFNPQSDRIEVASVWEKAIAGGGFPGDNKQNAVTDNEGNIYITGYFNGEATFGETHFVSTDSTDNVFIAKYNKAGNVLWATKGTDHAVGHGYNIAMDNMGNIYVSGTFEKLMAFGPLNIVFPKGREGIFLLKMNSGGEVEWIRQPDFDTSAKVIDLILVSEFAPNGDLIKEKAFPFDPNYLNYGINFDEKGNIYYSATFSSTLGLKIDKLTLGLEANFDPVITLKDETDKQIMANCEHAIAGLFGALNLIKLENVSLSGKILQQALDKYNPTFNSRSPHIYECFGKLKLMKNNAGIITVFTEDRRPVLLDKIKITDGTRLRIIMLPNGDARIDILNGIKVGKAIIWYDLNNIRLFRLNGNVTFDYDTDHTQITLNMRKDMLN